MRLKSVDSTNRFCRDEAFRGVDEGLVVVADLQTAGRGRRDRRWVAPERSSLLCSLLFRPPRPIMTFHLVQSAVALASCDAISELTSLSPTLKWPNDVMVDDHKVAGVLAEIVENTTRELEPHGHNPQRWPALVVGIGINVSWPDGWPDDESDTQLRFIAKTATTLERASGTSVDREALLSGFLRSVERRYGGFLGPDGLSDILTEYRACCSTIGQAVHVELSGERFDAEATGIDEDGRLLVEHRGEQRRLDAADVVHLRMTTP